MTTSIAYSWSLLAHRRIPVEKAGETTYPRWMRGFECEGSTDVCRNVVVATVQWMERTRLPAEPGVDTHDVACCTRHVLAVVDHAIAWDVDTGHLGVVAWDVWPLFAEVEG